MERYLVYFWTTENKQFVKIGHCKGHLYRRKSSLQNGCPLPICEYPKGVINCEDKEQMLKVERVIQKQFSACRTIGEWFSFTPEISNYIQEFADTQLGRVLLEADRKRYQNDPELRERQREYQRKSRKDPKNRGRELEIQRERERQLRKDPEVRERQREYDRKYRARKKRENQSVNGQQLTFLD